MLGFWKYMLAQRQIVKVLVTRTSCLTQITEMNIVEVEVCGFFIRLSKGMVYFIGIMNIQKVIRKAYRSGKA